MSEENLGARSNNRPATIEWICSIISVYVNKVNIFWVRFFVVLTIVALPVVSIWYSGWFADAQQALHKEIISSNIANKITEEVGKPSFYAVAKYHIFDIYAPPFWTIISILGFFITQMLQIWIKEENKSLLNKNNNLTTSIANRDKEIEVLKNNLFSLKKEWEKKLLETENFYRGKLEREVEEHDATRKHYMYSVKQELNNFFKSQNWFDKYNCRLSLYRFDKNKKMAYLMHRCCNISEYENKGRIVIPASEGFISAVLKNGEKVFAQINRFDCNDQVSYLNEMRAELNRFRSVVSDETFNNTRMRSCIYYCRAVREQGLVSNDKFAVFVIESEDPSAFSDKNVDRIFDASNEDIYRIVNHLNRLDSITNPIKEML